MDSKIVKKIVQDALERFPTRHASERLDATADPQSLLPAIMRDAGRQEVLDYFVSRLTGAYDIRFDEPKQEPEPSGPIPVDDYLMKRHVR